MVRAPNFNQTSFTAVCELLSKRREHAAAIAVIDGHLTDFLCGLALLIAAELPGLGATFAGGVASVGSDEPAPAAPVGPALAAAGAFHKPVNHPDCPPRCRLYQINPGGDQYQGVGPHGELFDGALDSVLASLKQAVAP
jgi:hypothetical protein